MMNRIGFALVLLALSGGAARAQMAPVPPIAQAENAFAVDLYGKLRTQPGNLFFSPYSISTALSMVFMGAKGETADQIARVLHLELLGAPAGESPALLAADFKGQQLFADPTWPGDFQFDAANALWGAKRYAFNPAFISIVKDKFGGDLKRVNMMHPEATAAQINNWVSAQTQGKIQNLINPPLITPLTRMVLTNAVYFKADWDRPFYEGSTNQQNFTISPSHNVMTPMMHGNGFFMLTQAKGVKILSLPYGYDDASMIIILPDDKAGLAGIEADLTANEVNGWIASGLSVPVILAIPKFETTDKFELSDVLKSLGIKSAFDPTLANLTGIADIPADPLFISLVIHQAHVDVDEKGTEAAAATAIVTISSGGAWEGPPPPPPFPFIADHPFIYLIRANKSGEILFMGRVDDPTQSGN
jgi:serpin B